MEEKITLAFETGVGGGSAALFKNEREIGFWVGDAEHKRLDMLLEAVGALLKRHSLKATEVVALAASRGPGSYTGLRSGLALCLGLKKALNCQFETATVLEAMAETAPGKNRIITAIPFGRDQICRQSFRRTPLGCVETDDANIVKFDEFRRYTEFDTAEFCVTTEDIADRLEHRKNEKFVNLIKVSDNLAGLIGRHVLDREPRNASDNVNIIYPEVYSDRNAANKPHYY